MIKISIKDWTHEQWLEYRRTGIGGSDASAIVGLNPYCSAYHTYLDKLGQVEAKADNEAMRQGRDQEQYVAQRFEEKTGKKVQKCNFILRSEEHPFMFANVDRMVVGEKAILECKTTTTLNKNDFANGEIPPTYYCQCQHYMAVTGYNKVYLAVLVFGKAFYTFEINRNEEDISALIRAEEDFWVNHVEKKVDPAPDGSDDYTEMLKSRYPEAKADSSVDLFLVKESQFERLDEVKRLIKALETEEKAIQQSIQSEMKDAEQAFCGKYAVTWKTQSRTTVDGKKLQADYPEVYAQYVKESKFRKFSYKEIKEEK